LRDGRSKINYIKYQYRPIILNTQKAVLSRENRAFNNDSILILNLSLNAYTSQFGKSVLVHIVSTVLEI